MGASFFEDHYVADADSFFEPFEEVGVDFEEQTGADWMRVMLAASLGGVVVEGVSLSGSSEVIFKTNFDDASENAVGRIRHQDKPKFVESVDLAGTMVAKTTAKFRGVGRANAFGLALEDTLWSSTSVSRVRDASFLAASLVAMGCETDSAIAMTSDVLGEPLPYELVSSVVTPLSVAKRDAATTVKNRSSVFLPQYELQAVVWDDTQLQGRLISEEQAVDWGRVTGVAKYIGTVNSMLDARFKAIAAAVGIPYRLVKGHAAVVTSEPYRVADEWNSIPRVESPFGSSVANASNIATAVEDKVRLTIEDLAGVETGSSARAILKAIAAARVRRIEGGSILTMATDQLMEITSVAYTPRMAASITIGTDSAHRAFLGAATDYASGVPTAVARLGEVLELDDQYDMDEGVCMAKIKRAAEAVITPPVFLDATARLTEKIGNSEVAKTRMARFKRSILRNSSALSDNVVIRSDDCTYVAPVIKRVAKAVILGNTGICLPPATLRNPGAAIEAHDKMRLLREARDYLNLAKEYWSARYNRKASFLLDRDKSLSIKYSVAAKAFRVLKAHWLLEWKDDFIPPGELDRSYIVSCARNYTRKRSEDIATVKPLLGESAIEYARRIDEEFDPTTPFTEVVEFVTTKLRMLATDFSVNKLFTEPDVESDEEESAPVAAPTYTEEEERKMHTTFTSEGQSFAEIMAEMTAMLAAPIPEKTWQEIAATWKDKGNYELAATDNGYSTFEEAARELKTACAYDTENAFTRVYMRASAKRNRATMEAGESDVI